MHIYIVIIGKLYLSIQIYSGMLIMISRIGIQKNFSTCVAIWMVSYSYLTIMSSSSVKFI